MKTKLFSNPWMFFLLGVTAAVLISSIPNFILMIKVWNNKENYRSCQFRVIRPYFEEYPNGSDWGYTGEIEGVEERYSLAMDFPRLAVYNNIDSVYKRDEVLSVLIDRNFNNLTVRVLPENYDFNKVKVRIFKFALFIYLPFTFIFFLMAYSYFSHKASLRKKKP